MNFVAILVALLLDQARPAGGGSAVHVAMRSWVSWSGRNFDAGQTQHAWLAWCMAVLAPSAAVLSVYWVLAHAAGWPFAVAWNMAVLYFTLGFRQFSHHFTEIRDALEAGDEARARVLLASWQRIDANGLPRNEIVRQVVEHSVIAAHRHVFGVLAWFSVMAVLGLGPVGAVLYRLSEFVPRYWLRENEAGVRPVSGTLRQVAASVWQWIDWLPARITAMGFAVVGSFEDAIDSWRTYERGDQVDNDGVILASTAGAINLCLGPAGQGALSGVAANSIDVGDSLTGIAPVGQEPEVGHLRTVVGLVWRTVVMWMILLALLTLARLLG